MDEDIDDENVMSDEDEEAESPEIKKRINNTIISNF